MKLLFLGSASGLAINADNFQSNMILSCDNGKKLLIDCGTDIRFSLTKAHFKPDDIDAVYISHLHADHVGGLEWFVFQRKFLSHNGLPQLLIHEELIHRLWDHSLKGGLETLKEKQATLNDYFIVNSIKDGDTFFWEGLQLNLIKTVHIYSNNKLMPSYGLNISCNGKSFLITADTQFSLQTFEKYYQNATLIFHDCETKKDPSGVHAHFSQLDTLSSEIKSKIWLYHFNDGELPDAKSHGFLGFIRCGQVIDM